MKLDLDSKSRAELEKIRKDVDKALKTLDERERKAALEAAEQAARAHGFKLAELTQDLRKASGRQSKSVNPPKYRNPADPSQTWSGRGRKPQWIKDAQKAGKHIGEFLI